jgi:hypothetical protein
MRQRARKLGVLVFNSMLITRIFETPVEMDVSEL